MEQSGMLKTNHYEHWISYPIFSDFTRSFSPEQIFLSISLRILLLTKDHHTLIKINLNKEIYEIKWYGAVVSIFGKNNEFLFLIYHHEDYFYFQISPTITQLSPSIQLYNELVSLQNWTIKQYSDHEYFVLKQNSTQMSNLMKNKDLTKIISRIQDLTQMMNDIPVFSGFIIPKVWKDLWIPPHFDRHQINYVFPKQSKKNLLGQTQNLAIRNFLDLSLYDQILFMDDLIWYRPIQTQSFFEKFVSHFSPVINFKTSVFNNKVERSTEKIKQLVVSPPIWSHFALDYIKYTGSSHILNILFKKFKAHLDWWEKNRFSQKYGLFISHGNVEMLEIETKCFFSPRFRTKLLSSSNKLQTLPANFEKEMILPDINAQLCDFYQNMGVFSLLLGNSDFQNYFDKAEAIQQHYQLLWDQNTSFYYDFDLETNSLHKLKTNAGFWALFGGCVSKSHLSSLVSHLFNPNEFYSSIPLPHISFDEQERFSFPSFNYSNLANIYWLVLGLKKYSLDQIAAKITLRTLKTLTQVYQTQKCIPSFCTISNSERNEMQINGNRPISFSLLQKMNILNPSALQWKFFYHSPLPLHSLYYKSILGAEILDDIIYFVPNWEILENDLSFSFHYRGKQIDGYLSKKAQKTFAINSDLQILKNY
ncbi:MAG: hypothetical protein K9W44_07245 [Candidatus Lokiarchaeota archaeon]|nr:hypothetical protein [Candidatus Harpocratesius repetitus]